MSCIPQVHTQALSLLLTVYANTKKPKNSDSFSFSFQHYYNTAVPLAPLCKREEILSCILVTLYDSINNYVHYKSSIIFKLKRVTQFVTSDPLFNSLSPEVQQQVDKILTILLEKKLNSLRFNPNHPCKELFSEIKNMEVGLLTEDFLTTKTTPWTFEKKLFFTQQILEKRTHLRYDPNQKVQIISRFFRLKIFPSLTKVQKKMAHAILEKNEYLKRGILREEIGLPFINAKG